MQELQWRRLKDIMNYAYLNVPFYGEKFAKAGVTPEDVRSFTDLESIPITTKSELQESNSKILAKNFLPRDCATSYTSGSTG